MKYKKLKICFVLGIVLPGIFILTAYMNIPSQIVIPTDYEYSYHLPYFTSISAKKEAAAQTSFTETQPIAAQNDGAVQIKSTQTGDYNFSVSLFDCIPLKNISVSVVPRKSVMLGGQAIGVKLYTDGLLVVNTSNVTCDDGKVISPAKDAGIRQGDRILSVNGQTVHSSEDFSVLLDNCGNAAALGVARGSDTFSVTVPIERSKSSNQVKVGLWVRDSTAGIGTVTFFDDGYFAALGHAITDIDTGEIMTVHDGAVLDCTILSVKKGERGEPGELLGNFSGQSFGNILINDNIGIYGKIKKEINENQTVIPVATRSQIQTGPAYIVADIDGSAPKKYQAEIQKVSKSNKINNKGLVLKITDEELLNKTGGIVQGMSGAPIIQNDMLVGAVTHVFVNDPTRGYGVFAENMLYMTEKLKK